MLHKIKKAIQKTFIYTIYIFFVDLYRNRKRKINKLKAKWNKYYTLHILFPRTYKKYAKLPVDENKVVFIEVRFSEITNSFRKIYDELANNYNYDINCHFLRNVFISKKEYNQRCLELMKDVATAKYIFTDDASDALGSLDMRPETVYTQLWHGCGAFKKFGFSTAELIFGLTREQMLKYPTYKNITNVTVSSPEVIWAYEEAMGFKEKPGIVKATGVSRTDYFYSEEYIKSAFEKLHKVMPESVGKKVILYAPTFRGRVAKAISPDMLSVKYFKEAFCDEYVLLFKHHPLVKNPPEISPMYADFAKDVTDSMTIEELLCVSDICISDYSSLVFEYSLFEKPLIFYAFDIDEYNDWRGFYYNYDELAPGPVFTSNLEMIDYIKNIETRFDKQRVHAFREKFMSSCDGHATERIMDMVFGESLESHKKAENEITDYPLHTIPDGMEPFEKEEKELIALRNFKQEANSLYKAAMGQEVKKGKVAVLTDEKSSSAKTLAKLLKKEKDFSVVTLGEGSAKNAAELADAQFVVTEGESKLLRVLDIRKETEIIELCENALPSKKEGYASMKFKAGFEKKNTEIAPLFAKYNTVTVASDFAKEAYSQIYGIKDENVFEKIGSMKSDILFDEEFINSTKKKIVSAFPQAEGKKIIFYMPEERIDKVTRPAQAAFFDTKEMFEYLKNDYVVLYKYSDIKNNKLAVSKYFGSFICNMDNIPSTDEAPKAISFSETELMAAADIVIGDYKTSTFDFIATQKPIFFYTPDLAVQNTGADNFADYEEITQGLRYTDTVKLAKDILSLENYDFDRLKKLKAKYFTYCDGNTGKKLVELMKSKI